MEEHHIVREIKYNNQYNTWIYTFTPDFLLKGEKFYFIIIIECEEFNGTDKPEILSCTFILDPIEIVLVKNETTIKDQIRNELLKIFEKNTDTEMIDLINNTGFVDQINDLLIEPITTDNSEIGEFYHEGPNFVPNPNVPKVAIDLYNEMLTDYDNKSMFVLKGGISYKKRNKTKRIKRNKTKRIKRNKTKRMKRNKTKRMKRNKTRTKINTRRRNKTRKIKKNYK